MSLRIDLHPSHSVTCKSRNEIGKILIASQQSEYLTVFLDLNRDMTFYSQKDKITLCLTRSFLVKNKTQHSFFPLEKIHPE